MSDTTWVIWPVGAESPMYDTKWKGGKAIRKIVCFKLRRNAVRDIDTFARGPRKREFEVRKVSKAQVRKWNKEMACHSL